jgi:hypothetical protein
MEYINNRFGFLDRKMEIIRTKGTINFKPVHWELEYCIKSPMRVEMKREEDKDLEVKKDEKNWFFSSNNLSTRSIKDRA